MIKTLTKKQKDVIPIFIEKWVSRGLDTSQLSYSEIYNIVNNLNKYVLLEKQKPIFIFNSPIECWFFILINLNIHNQTRNQVVSQVVSQVWDQVRNQVVSQVVSQVRDQVWRQVGNQVGSQVVSQVENQVRDQVWDQVGNQVGRQVVSQVRDQVRSQVDNQVDNQVRDQVRSQVENQVRSQVDNQVVSQVWNQVWNQVRSQVENQVRDQVWNQVRSQVDNQVDNQVGNQVWNQVRSQVENQVWNQVDNQVRNQVRDQVWNQVRSQVWSQVWNQVRSQVWSQVRNQVRNQVENQVGKIIFPYLYGHLDSVYFSWCDFMQHIGVQRYPESYIHYVNTYKTGFIFCLNDFIVVCQKPSVIKRNNFGLHCENGPAMAYNDNTISEWYYLNGVPMTKKYVMTPSEKLHPQDILKETNVEVRRELLRKIGIERTLCFLPHKVINKMENYELLSIQLNDEIQNAKYLKMLNPSIGAWHLEAVAPECLTVEHAINWRANRNIDTKWNPQILT